MPSSRLYVTPVTAVGDAVEPLTFASTVLFAIVAMAVSGKLAAVAFVRPMEDGVPVRFVITPLAGVPKAGAVIVGDVSVLFVSVCVAATPTAVSVAAGHVQV